MEQKKAEKPRTLLSSAIGKVSVGETCTGSWRIETEYATVIVSLEELKVLQERIADVFVQMEERDANTPLVKLGPGGDFERDYTPGEHRRALDGLAEDIKALEAEYEADGKGGAK